ncbi:aromatic acid exporter family protein [Pseudalkalibacillus berkeleyi]|uniref:Aromatic acid exporter family protein n=1 Tax=Pseudalkalibacillus berkeleyi TaxID=1069813 RepID=A0ABS9H1U6_9BACL|nr:aromatic acid exporter family protein [Pseudalkalibacillus berkeleyi]MCF6137808.1 aromatic acid exporter family protein [Pseudalkalibacillus berkeleyi]
MKFQIGYRTIKTAIAAPIAILIAQAFQLEFYVSAGILAILCIKVTKKKSVVSSWERFAACLIGIVFAFVFFEGISYHPLVLGLLLIIFIPTMVALKLKEGVITSSVIVLHFLVLKDFSFAIVMNELGIIVIGIGMALIMNLYMPSMETELRALQRDLESKFQKILREFAWFLREGESLWDGAEIVEVDHLIQKAKSMAFKDIENHLTRHEDQYYNYFKMREKQYEILGRVMPIITSIDRTYAQNFRIADFMDDLAEAVHPGNTAQKYLDELEQMRQAFKHMDLPKDRSEFETRSALHYFLTEMEQYLILKRYFKARDE